MGVPVTNRYYMTIATQSNAAKFGRLETTAPTAATTTFGWRMGTFATASTTAQKQVAAEVANTAAAGWRVGPTASVPIPLRGDGWIMGPFNGFFEAGTWQISMSLRSVSNGSTQLGRLLYKVYTTSDDPAVTSSYSSLTPVWVSSSITPSLSTTNVQRQVTASANFPSFRLKNQYIIFQELFQVTTAGGNTNADADWSYGQTAGQTGANGVSASILPSGFFQATPPFVNWITDEYPTV